MPAPGPPVAGTDGTATGLTGTCTLPATVDPDDIIVVFAIDHSPTSPGTAFDWNNSIALTEGQRAAIKNSAGATVGQAGWAWMRAAGTEDGASVNVVRNGDSGNDSWFGTHCCTIPGCITTGDPFDVSVFDAPNAVSPADIPSITTLTADSLLLSGILKGGENDNYATPANWTVLLNASRTAGSDGSIDVDYRQVTTAQAYDPASPTFTVDADTGYFAFQIAFIPPAAGGSTVTGTAALDSTAALAALGLRQILGVAALSSPDALAVAGLRRVLGLSALSSPAALSVAGARHVLGAAALSSLDALGVTGLRVVLAASALSSDVQLVVLGEVETPGGTVVLGTASLSSVAALLASGTRHVVGSSALSSSDTLSVAGLREVLAIAALDSDALLAVLGDSLRIILGTASLTDGFTLRAIGGPPASTLRGRVVGSRSLPFSPGPYAWPMFTTDGQPVFAVRSWVVQVPYARYVADADGQTYRVVGAGVVEPV